MRRRIKGALIAILIFGFGGAAFQATLEASRRGWLGVWPDNYEALSSWQEMLASYSGLISPWWLLLTVSFAAGCLVSLLIEEQSSRTRHLAGRGKPATGCYCEISFEGENSRKIRRQSNIHDVFWTPFDANRSFLYILFDNYFAPRSQRIHVEGSTSRVPSRMVHKTSRYCVILTKQIEPPVVLRVSVFGDALRTPSPAVPSDERLGHAAQTSVSEAA
jgi:hypothetical protein